MRRFVRVSLVAGIGAVLLGGMVGVAAVVAGGGCHVPSDAASTEDTGSVVKIDTCTFGPTLLQVSPGTTVTWHNADRVGHAVTGINWGTSETFMPGDSVTHSFPQPGIFPYQCYLHPGMSGVVVVGAAGSIAAPGSTAPQAAPVPAPETKAQAAAGTDTQAPAVGLLLAIAAMSGLTGAAAGVLIARRQPRPALRALPESVSDPIG